MLAAQAIGAAIGARNPDTHTVMRQSYGSLELAAFSDDAGLNLQMRPVSPGRFARRVLAMFLCLAPELGFRDAHRKVIAAVESPESSIDISPWRIMTRLFVGPRTRTVGVMAMANLHRGSARRVMEVAFPPFSFLLQLSESETQEGAADVAP